MVFTTCWLYYPYISAKPNRKWLRGTILCVHHRICKSGELHLWCGRSPCHVGDRKLFDRYSTTGLIPTHSVDQVPSWALRSWGFACYKRGFLPCEAPVWKCLTLVYDYAPECNWEYPTRWHVQRDTTNGLLLGAFSANLDNNWGTWRVWWGRMAS